MSATLYGPALARRRRVVSGGRLEVVRRQLEDVMEHKPGDTKLSADGRTAYRMDEDFAWRKLPADEALALHEEAEAHGRIVAERARLVRKRENGGATTPAAPTPQGRSEAPATVNGGGRSDGLITPSTPQTFQTDKPQKGAGEDGAGPGDQRTSPAPAIRENGTAGGGFIPASPAGERRLASPSQTSSEDVVQAGGRGVRPPGRSTEGPMDVTPRDVILFVPVRQPDSPAVVRLEHRPTGIKVEGQGDNVEQATDDAKAKLAAAVANVEVGRA